LNKMGVREGRKDREEEEGGGAYIYIYIIYL
jgi:hypothetical protein